jgi:hypothetical protein
VTGIRARPIRTTRGGKRLRAARITFTLTAPGQVVFVVRGPAPSCRVAARFRISGERGVNHLRFTGRVRRRTLPHGTYRITAGTPGGPRTRPVVVVVGDRARDVFACAAPVRASDGFAAVLGAFGSDDGAVTPPKRKRSSNVLPAVAERLRKLPQAIPTPTLPAAAGPVARVVGIAALLLLVASGLALAAYVIRFVRGPAT